MLIRGSEVALAFYELSIVLVVNERYSRYLIATSCASPFFVGRDLMWLFRRCI